MKKILVLLAAFGPRFAFAQTQCQPIPAPITQNGVQTALRAVRLNCQPSACPIGQAPNGIDEQGDALNCLPVSSQTYVLPITFLSSATFLSSVTVQGITTLNSSTTINGITNIDHPQTAGNLPASLYVNNNIYSGPIEPNDGFNTSWSIATTSEGVSGANNSDGGTLPVWGIDWRGHEYIYGSTITITSCGTGGSIGPYSNDIGGTFTTGTGGTACTINFFDRYSSNHNNTVYCLCSGPTSCYESANSFGQTITFSGLTAGDTYVYRCWATGPP